MNGKECGEVLHGHDQGHVREVILGPFRFRPMANMQKGDRIAGHKHNYDHVTLLYRGSVTLRKWLVFDETTNPPVDVSKITTRSYKAFSRIVILKDWVHEFTALEDGTSADCLYVLRDFDGNVAEEWNGDEEPYR